MSSGTWGLCYVIYIHFSFLFAKQLITSQRWSCIKTRSACWAGKVVLSALSKNFYECIDPTVCSSYRGTFCTMVAFQSHTRTCTQQGALKCMQSELYSFVFLRGIFVANVKQIVDVCMSLVLYQRKKHAFFINFQFCSLMHIKQKFNSPAYNRLKSVWNDWDEFFFLSPHECKSLMLCFSEGEVVCP